MKLKLIYLTISIFMYTGLNLNAQKHKYLFLFKDKNNSVFNIKNPETFLSKRSIDRRIKQKIAITQHDLPVNQNHVTSIQQMGAKIWYKTKWMNGVIAECDSTTMLKIKTLPFVKGIEANTYLESPEDDGTIENIIPDSTEIAAYEIVRNKDVINYGESKNQIEMLGIDKLHKAGFHGEGMMIGIVDDGFRNANKVPFFKTIFDEKRIVNTYNFVRNLKDVYNDGGHGTNVMSVIAADLEGELYGGAYKSSFVLMATEDNRYESLVEETNMLVALEYADSIGVDVLNASLGYYDLDNEATAHSYEDRNGNKTIAAKAADWAVSKGMVFVVSAGNDGENDHIATPADADSVLAIGSVNEDKTYHNISSIGPRTDGITKPDVMAKGAATTIGDIDGNIRNGSGTSFAAPLITGLVATFWQANPSKTAFEIIEAIRRSGSNYPYASPLLGYGVASYTKALSELLNPSAKILSLEKETVKFEISPNPFNNNRLPKIVLKEKNAYFNAFVTDLQGKVLWQSTSLKSSTILPLSHLKTGEYILKISNGNAFATHKLIKSE